MTSRSRRLRYSLGWLFIVTTVFCVALALWIAPYRERARFIAELRQQNVYVYTEYDGPEPLAWCLRDRSLFVRPVQVQVLLQPNGAKSVRLLGKSVAVADVHKELTGLYDRLQARFGGSGNFALVYGAQPFPEGVMDDIVGQQLRAIVKSDEECFYHLTPCGISNFRFVPELPDSAFGNRGPIASGR